MGTQLFQNLLIIFLVSIPLVIFFRKIRLPSILGFLLTGALIGPYGLGWIGDKAQIDLLAEIGVTLLLFIVGLEFSFESFAKYRRQGIASGVFQITLTAAAGYFIGHLLHWTPYQGLYFGCLLALSSTAVVLSSYYSLRRMESIAGRFSTVILILQDLVMIPMMVLLPWMGTVSQHHLPINDLSEKMGLAMLIVVLVAVSTKYLANPLLRFVSKTKSRELFTITVICFALGLAWVTHTIGLSFALGAFLGGLMVGSTQFQYQALSEIRPFQFIFNSIFFVSIGMLLNLTFVRENFLLVGLLVILLPMLKVILTTLVVFINQIPLRLALVVGISLGQIGEFSFLLAYMGHKNNVIPDNFYQLIISIAVVTMLMTPIFIKQAPKIAELICRIPESPAFLRHIDPSPSRPPILRR